jgi:predicted regulator of Ras-like GTPase activity (Roadblock/LC7/MglB family)
MGGVFLSTRYTMKAMLDISAGKGMVCVFTWRGGIITASRIFRPFHGCMFRFLRNLISKKSSAPIAVTVPVPAPMPRGVAAVPVRAVAPAAQPRAVDGGAGGPGVQRVETAQLQLAAIMSKFPDELRKLVVKMPPENAMVVMPIPAILRFLPTGSVKMSLASVVRQAPPGTFSTINPQDKRLVEVPLAEIFKRVSPAILKRRDDQRYTGLAAEGFDIFGDDDNPYNLAPHVEESLKEQQPAPPPPPPSPVVPQPRVLQMPPGMGAGQSANSQPPKRPSSPPTQPLAAKPRVAVPPTPFVPPPTAVPQAPAPAASAPSPEPIDDGQPPLVLPLKDLLSGWPEPIKSEAAALNGTTVALPSSQVGVGLARGKVAFNWGQIRAWMNPPPTTPTEASDSIELLLPLRVIAPAFLKHSRGSAPKKSASVAGDIPELFAGRGVPGAAPASPAPTSEAPPTPSKPAPAPTNDIPQAVFAPPRAKSTPFQPPQAPVPASIPEPEAAPEPSAPAAEEPVAESTPIEAEAPAPSPVEEVPVAEAPAPAVEAPPAEAEGYVPPATPIAAGSTVEPESLGEAFNQPGKTAWSPSEIINSLAELPEIAGSVVALQEGLVVAHRLPDPLKGEVFAAFLPQIFARINQYSNEMKLGAVDDLLINAHGLPCHLFRVGQVYFAALGKPGVPLPTPVLRLCAAALAS